MNYPEYSKRAIFLVIFTILMTGAAFSQATNPTEPRQEKLLNGLKLLLWSDPTADKVTIKVRIHSGSAFDPKDKMGVMTLLSEILFPTAQSKEFFTEELGGSLDITNNYDYIQITATGKSDETLTMVETLSNAIANPQITQENFVRVRDERLKKVQELEKNPGYQADRAVAKRLFGDFPYGRSVEGTSASLAKIDRADLLFARERFLTSDNATVAVIGNFKQDFVYRAVRRLFGAWTKSDKAVPPTFRIPDPPNTRDILSIPSENVKDSIYRIAMNGFARNDKNYFSSLILSKIWQYRLNKFPNSFVKNEAYMIRGIIISGFSPLGKDSKPTSNAEQIKPEEFEKAKSEMTSEFYNNHISDLWLDVDTYKLASVKDEIQKIQGVSLEETQKLFDTLQKQPYVSVVVEKKEAQPE